MSFNYSVTVDTLPPPNRPDCIVKPSKFGCFIGIHWYDDGTSSVAYSTDAPFIIEIVLTTTDRLVNASGSYTSHTSVSYVCPASNTTPCNIPDKLKRSIIATSLPNNDQMKQFDTWIAPTTEFNGSSCLDYSNLTKGCPETDLVNCQQCIISVSYDQEIDVCATCPAGKANFNAIEHRTLFYLDNRTDAHSVAIRCQMGNDCNSIENTEQVLQKLTVTLDYNKFFSSTASISKITVAIILSTLFTSLFHQL